MRYSWHKMNFSKCYRIGEQLLIVLSLLLLSLCFRIEVERRRKWQPTPVFLPGESQGRQSLAGCCLWGRTESDTTEVAQLSLAQRGLYEAEGFPPLSRLLCLEQHWGPPSPLCVSVFLFAIGGKESGRGVHNQSCFKRRLTEKHIQGKGVLYFQLQ